MKSCCGMILSLLMPLACHAAEVVAWKMPLSRYTAEDLQSTNINRCKAPPEASPFFKDGDELWDLKGAKPYMPENQDLSLDWIVWNATSERLVAKGRWTDICAIHEILQPGDIPGSLKLKLELYQVAADGAALDERSVPISEMSILVRSGQNYTASWSGSGSSIAAEVGATLGESEQVADIQLDLSAEVPEQPRLKVNTALTLRSGTSLWVARDFDGKVGLDLKASCQMESLNGVPYSERVMIQTGKATRSLKPRWGRHNDYPTPAGKDGWRLRCKLSPDTLTEYLSPQPEDRNADPFAETSSPKVHIPLPRVTTVTVPEFFLPWVDHELLDASGWLQKILPKTDFVGSFAGYDPIEESLYFYSPKREPADAVASMFEVLYCGGGPSGVIATLDGIGQTRLVSRSGQKASISRIAGEKSVQRSLEIEPTIGENGDMIEMRMYFEDFADGKTTTRLNSFNLFATGKPLELLSGTSSGGGERSLRMKAEVLRLSPEGHE